MTRLIGISGSLRQHSYHSGLLRAARQLAPDGVEVQIASIADIPSITRTSRTATASPPPWSSSRRPSPPPTAC